MRLEAILPLLALAGCAAPAPMPRSGGIVSTNPCADAMLVDLVVPGRIAAISQYSQDPAATSIPLDIARRFRSTAGTAEEVIALKPDLVLTSSFTPLATRAAYQRAGLRTLLLDSPTSIAASKAQVMAVAEAVGEMTIGRALVARIDRAVLLASAPEASAARRNGEDGISALLFISGDLATGSGTLLDELMHTAGLRNAAADYGVRSTGRLPIEPIAAHPPDIILSPGPSRTSALRARVLAATGVAVREATFPRTLINCGGPSIPPALARLAAIRRGLP